jgi:serine/threonine protein kinase
VPLPNAIGRYEIKAELGRGGMATGYRAYDPRFKREVALKILPREFLHDPQFRARFEREAETIAALEHPAIVPVHDFGEEDGQPYFVMRLMPGGSLADRLEKGPLPLTEAARIFSRLAPALDWAHAHGIIHRDLKPGNILFDDNDNPYISDFGIAKLTQASVTFTGSAIVGTPAYMSPEQARGEKDIDGRSDIYALGAIVFQMLTGRFPYETDTPMGMVVKHITEPVPRILDVKPDLPPACEGVIGQATAKNCNDRYATAGAMELVTEQALAAVVQPTATPTVHPPTATPTLHPPTATFSLPHSHPRLSLRPHADRHKLPRPSPPGSQILPNLSSPPSPIASPTFRTTSVISLADGSGQVGAASGN